MPQVSRNQNHRFCKSCISKQSRDLPYTSMAIKDFLRGKKAAALPNADGPRTSSPTEDSITEKGQYDDESHVPFLSIHSFFMAILVSMGWSSVSLGKSGLEIASGLFSFGYDTDQISGFLATKDFKLCGSTESTTLRRCLLQAHCHRYIS